MLHVHCSICQESLKEDSDIAALLCGHVFHDKCISSWLSTRSNCPHCRSANTGNYIKKLYFDKVSEVNLSIFDTSDSSLESTSVISKLNRKIDKLIIENAKIDNERSSLIINIQNQIDLNESLNKDLKNSEDLQRSQYLLLNDQLFEKDKEVEKFKIQLDKLKFMNDMMNKSESKILLEISKTLNSNNHKEEIEKLCSTLICFKSELDFYKEQSETLSKKLSRSETKNLLLQTTVDQLQEEINVIKCPSDSPNIFSTPEKSGVKDFLREKSADISLSTPDQSSKKGIREKFNISDILISSPDTPGISVKDRINRELIAANPFACSNKLPKKDFGGLYKLSIMRNHNSRPFIAESLPQNLITKKQIKEYEDKEEEEENEEPVKKKIKAPRSKHIQPIDRNMVKYLTKDAFKKNKF